ncbi:MAG: hypothetical protein ACE37K_18285 [Planctomycetota bacterium]
MHIESHATPFGGTPQQRYATLHRAIEQGLDSDDVWVELASVCQAMGHRGEALHCVQRIHDDERRARSERALLSPAERRKKDHPGAPAASHAGRSARDSRDARSDELPGVAEHLTDACQYLLHQQMPMLVLTTMLAFPLVVGVGGFLTAGGSLLLLAAIAALPGLSVLSVVAAMGRQILLRSSEGEGDVPELPVVGRLLRDARSFAFDATLVVGGYFALPAVMLAAGAPWYSALPSLMIGAVFAPLTFALRQVRGDMRAFSPVFLLRAVRRAGRGYPVVALAATLAFAPAFAVAFAVLDRPVWVQIAVVGPLMVLPVFATARLLGSWLDTNRTSLGYLMLRADETLRDRTVTDGGTAAQKPNAPRSLRRPEALDRFRTPQVQKPATGQPPRAQRPTAPARPQARPAAAQPARRPGPRAIEGRKPAQRTAPPTGTTRRPAPQGSGQPPRRAAGPAKAGLEDRPDLASMPGAVVVSGNERARHGAAARRE